MEAFSRPAKYEGRHYETGVIVNTLAAMGVPMAESLALGASGGIAFGYFVFEYTGHLPHVALLTRNTFSPFERALDNLGIRRTLFETLKPEKGEENLRRELDFGNPVIVWAATGALPYKGIDCESYGAQPLLVVGYDQDSFHIVDGTAEPFSIPAETLRDARTRIKKDRNRIMTFAKPNEEAVVDGIRSALATCAALYLDKPPAGAAHNFGIAGMAYMSKMLRDKRNALSWTRKFEPGPRLLMALAGTWTQPGLWDWVESWGSQGSADRATYADFLEQAAPMIGKPILADAAAGFRATAPLWSQLADLALPDVIGEFKTLRALKRQRSILRTTGKPQTELRAEMDLVRSAAEPKLAAHAEDICNSLANTLDEIASIEREAAITLRRI